MLRVCEHFLFLVVCFDYRFDVDLVVGNRDYRVLVEGQAHDAFCVALDLELADALGGDHCKDVDGTTVGPQSELCPIVVQRVTVDVLPLAAHHLKLRLLHVPHADLLVVAVHQLPAIFGQ